LIQHQIIEFVKGDVFHELGPVTTGLPAVLPAITRIEMVINGRRPLIEFPLRLNCNHGKPRWD
jgi:hypothetical protein